MKFSAKEFDRFLSENCVKPNYAIIDASVWNGYWTIKRTNKFFRWLGRKIHNKYIYWLGFQVKWIDGLKTTYLSGWSEIEEDEEENNSLAL